VEFGLVSCKRGDFVSPLKRQPQDALAAIAGCAKKKDFHKRISTGLTAQALQDSTSHHFSAATAERLLSERR
jgi:hypothetical protein